MSVTFKEKIINKIKNKSCIVGIIGLGYVGIPLMLRFIEEGFKVIGFDSDPERVKQLNLGKSPIKHICEDAIKNALNNGFKAQFGYEGAQIVDAFIMCVPTPLNKYREPDISYIIQSIEAIIPCLHDAQLIALESTTYPGTTEEELLPRIESAGMTVGEDIFLVFSPEREDPGNKQYNTSQIPKICGGITSNCLDVGVSLYEKVINKVVPVSNARTAEMTKLLENIHRAINIGLVNEMKIVADKMGIDIHEVIRAAATKPFGFVPYYPGPGLGGHCIPIDPFYLTWKAREYGIHTRFIELAGEINSSMPDWVIQKVVDALNEQKKSLKDSKILVLGLAYKKNVDDMRESPTIKLIEILITKGAKVSYADPFIPIYKDNHNPNIQLQGIELTPEAIKEYDLLLIATNHDDFDYHMIQQNAKVIVDTRGVYLDKKVNVVKA